MKFNRISTGEVLEFTGLSKNNLDQLEKKDKIIEIPKRGTKFRYYPFELILWLKLYASIRHHNSHRVACLVLPKYQLINKELLSRKYLLTVRTNGEFNYQFLDIESSNILLQGLIKDNAIDPNIFDWSMTGHGRYIMILLLEKYREKVNQELLEYIERFGNGKSILIG